MESLSEFARMFLTQKFLLQIDIERTRNHHHHHHHMEPLYVFCPEGEASVIFMVRDFHAISR